MAELNECIPFYEPGQRITAECEAAVTGGRFVAISNDIGSGPGLSATAEGGNIVISTADVAGGAIGVASHNAGIGDKVTVISGGVVPVVAEGAIAAGDGVEVGANGKAETITAGELTGICLSGVADGEEAMVLLK